MTYRAPVTDIAFALKHSAGFGSALAEGLYGDLDEEVVDAVLAEAGRFASDIIAPLNAIGDRQGARLKDGIVTTPDGWKQAYRDWAAAGWNGLSGPTEWAARGCRMPSIPPALKCGTQPRWPSALVRFSPWARSKL